MDFERLYEDVLKDVLAGREGDFSSFAHSQKELDCLLSPEKYAAVIKTGECGGGCDKPCIKSCIFDAISTNTDGSLFIDSEKCKGCTACVEACHDKNIVLNRDVIAAIKTIRDPKTLSYALIAPAFIGQFSGGMTPGKLRTALKQLGFDGMIEVALFADILTLKEALEFNAHVTKDGDFQLTSCCCPIWIAMLKKVYTALVPHIPTSVSPMIAAGRVIKLLHPNAVTVFFGPCVAKKSEAREKDIAGAVDYVLTFQETADLFRLANIDPKTLDDNDKDHSSRAGRIYAVAGGVSDAVKRTVEQLAPNREIPFTAETADGVPACREMIEKLKSGTRHANFYEGMGCNGGCVGGLKTIIDKALGTANVTRYADLATYKTPVENPYVLELLKRLGFDTIESLLEESDLFSRKF